MDTFTDYYVILPRTLDKKPGNHICKMIMDTGEQMSENQNTSTIFPNCEIVQLKKWYAQIVLIINTVL